MALSPYPVRLDFNGICLGNINFFEHVFFPLIQKTHDMFTSMITRGSHQPMWETKVQKSPYKKWEFNFWNKIFLNSKFGVF